MTGRLVLVLALVMACSSSPQSTSTELGPRPQVASDAAPVAPSRDQVTLAIIGTNDLHGQIAMLPYLQGHLDNLRRSKTVDEVVLIDGGDMFQGTLESNLGEGESVIAAYNHMGYVAAAVGNHEFDFGPVGPESVPIEEGDDPRGALKARTAQAEFPLLAANLLDADTGKRATWPGLQPAVLIERQGIRIGIIGVSTIDTPRTTTARNFVGLAMAPLAETVAEHASQLRGQGAQLVIVTAHAGGKCKSFEDPGDRSSCESGHEIFEVAEELPKGAVDIIVAGHTHSGVAHEVAGIAVIESFANGRAFGRVDVTFDKSGAITERTIHPPRWVCGETRSPPRVMAGEQCEAGNYAGSPVEPDKTLWQLAARYHAQADEVRQKPLGVEITDPVERSFAAESPLGNLFVDLMLEARPKADVAITNGGGLRADLPSGPLTYGELYEAMPFDNRFATVALTGSQLATLIANNLKVGRGIFSIAGVRATARCVGDTLQVDLRRAKRGKRIGKRERLTLVTSDFLASGGDGMLADLGLAPDAVVLHDDGPTMRDAFAERLSARGGTLSGKVLFDAKSPRLRYPGKRPVSCPR